MHILLLLRQEMRTHGIQRVRAQLVVPLHDHEHVHLQPAVQVDLLGITRAIGLAAEPRRSRRRLDRFYTAKRLERGRDAQGLGTVDLRRSRAWGENGVGGWYQVREIKVCGVVADDQVRVHGADKVKPGTDEVGLVVK